MRSNVPGGIRVVGVTEVPETAVGAEAPDAGEPVIAAPLGHGEHPDAVLAALGWVSGRPLGAVLADDGALELTYAVSPLNGIRTEAPAVARSSEVGPDEAAEPYQRVAAYAVVRGPRGVLLTQFNSQTGIPGQWGLPGGGLDEGEHPRDGVLREVWEETGQRVELGSLVTLQSQHWVGRSPAGVVEDFHAVRIVYRADCPEPTEIVIHDVGGTTAAARWVTADELPNVPMTASWRDLAELTEGSA